MSSTNDKSNHWTHSSTPTEVMHRIGRYSSIDKWVPFFYFAKSKDPKKHQLFLELLDSEYYTADELAARAIHIPLSTIKFWPEESRKEFAARVTTSPNLKELISGRITRSKSKDVQSELFLLLSLLVKDDKEFIDYLKALKTSDIASTYSHSPELHDRLSAIADSAEPEAKVVQAMLVNGHYQNMISSLKEDLPKISELRAKDSFSDWKSFTFLGTNSESIELFEELLALDIISPKLIKETYTKEELKKFHPALERYLRPDNWKYSTSPSFIARRVPESKTWEAYEYFLESNPTLLETLEKRHPSIWGKKKALMHYLGEDSSTFSPALQKKVGPLIERHREGILRSAETRQQLKEARDAARSELIPEDLKDWLTTDNTLKKFFTLAGDKEIVSKEEYLQIADIFITSDLSAAAFCHKYRISDLEGFRKMLKQVAAENKEFALKLEEKNRLSSKKYLLSAKHSVQLLLTKKIDVQTFIEEDPSSSRKLKDYIEFVESTYNDPRITALFCKKIVDYYYDRLNSYNLSIEPENIQKMLTSKEVAFIAGAENFQKLISGKSIDLGAEFYGALLPSRDALRNLLQTKMNGNGSDKIRNKLSQYGEYFQDKKALGMTIGNYNGNAIEVDKAVLRTAHAFQKSNKLFPSSGTMTRIIRAIAEGKITCTPTEQSTPTAYEKMLSAASITEYFDGSLGEDD